MVIAIHYNTISEQTEDYNFFIQYVLPKVVQQHAQHQFYFYHFNKDAVQITAPNMRYVPLPAYLRIKIIQRWWYKNKWPSILASVQANRVISIGSNASTAVSLPQITIIANEEESEKPLSKKQTSILHKSLLKSIKDTDTVITFSKAFKQVLIEKVNGTDEKIKVVYNIPEPLALPNTEVGFSIMERYTDGKAYFIYTGPIVAQPMLHLLKAFSIFKKRQKSGMKLLIVNQGAADVAFGQTLVNYKYRSDVVYLEAPTENDLVALLSAAYAFVNPYQFNTAHHLLQSLLAGVPVITVANERIKEIAAGAILNAAAGNVADIADKMMMIYKDENLRSDMIKHGQLFKQNYSHQKTVNSIWQIIEETGK